MKARESKVSRIFLGWRLRALVCIHSNMSPEVLRGLILILESDPLLYAIAVFVPLFRL